MDADILRLILFLAGIGLILGIYFWDRHKQVNAKVHAIRKAQLEKGVASTVEEDPAGRIDPHWNATPESDGAESESTVTVASEYSDQDDLDQEELSQLGAITHQSLQEEAKAEPQASFSFTADDPDDEPDELLQEGLPGLILQINIVAVRNPFPGEAIMQVARDVELKRGDMNIFHRYASDKPKSRVVFSMASMVEPGIFPFDEIGGFNTPGLVLFGQLPGPKDGLVVFSDMLFTAERLAALLGGELQDETHSVLSKQTIEHMRGKILEHRRQVQLALSKR